MDPVRLGKWLDDQIAAVAPDRFPKLVPGQCQVNAQQLCELRRFALTGKMEGMSSSASDMKVADPSPFLARIDAHLDAWRARALEVEGEAVAIWIDEKRGLREKAAPPPRVLRGDPTQADAKLTAQELRNVEDFVQWLSDPRAVARDMGEPRRVLVGKPDPDGLRKLALLFEERFETMFPPELSALLSRVNGFEIQYADSLAPTSWVEPDTLDQEGALWSTAFDFDDGIEQAEVCYDGDGSEFAWPLYGVNFHRLYYVTGDAQSDARPTLTVWTYLQVQRDRERVGTFWEFLALMKR
jgi:hypothetical protein